MSPGHKIIEGLKQAAASNFARVTIEGQLWTRIYPDDDNVLVPQAQYDALIAAEPTEAMLNAARDWSYKKYGKPIGNEAAIGCWKTMHNAALRAAGIQTEET